MRFKLANGGIIASSKQPLQKRDFDRIECEECEANQRAYTSIIVSIVNPSTHTLRKAHNGQLYLMITPVSRNNKLRPFKGKMTNNILLGDMHTGMNTFSFEQNDMDGWQRDNVKINQVFKHRYKRDGNPWEPDSHQPKDWKTKISGLAVGEGDSFNGAHGCVYDGKLMYGCGPNGEVTCVKDRIIVSVWRGNDNFCAKHFRLMFVSQEFDVYLTFEEE